ncbi:hypothetical protein FHS43_005274 [Streptosporangium becharense]|uniref:Uncharacterized protein n=1 Tax=Streptosporangium becharense TaxID=1816182 RepID=A0A7W9III1_9ACTN|nr:hypothetical protein [Streptosporangium becharense]MBB5821374.1 hypothetical protein [Streptosporangium becharense]
MELDIATLDMLPAERETRRAICMVTCSSTLNQRVTEA